MDNNNTTKPKGDVTRIAITNAVIIGLYGLAGVGTWFGLDLYLLTAPQTIYKLTVYLYYICVNYFGAPPIEVVLPQIAWIILFRIKYKYDRKHDIPINKLYYGIYIACGVLSIAGYWYQGGRGWGI